MRINMKPPPPILPAQGWVTASANPTATAASTAFPPAFIVSTPASEAFSSLDTTMPCRAATGVSAVAGSVPQAYREKMANAKDAVFIGLESPALRRPPFSIPLDFLRFGAFGQLHPPNPTTDHPWLPDSIYGKTMHASRPLPNPILTRDQPRRCNRSLPRDRPLLPSLGRSLARVQPPKRRVTSGK